MVAVSGSGVPDGVLRGQSSGPADTVAGLRRGQRPVEQGHSGTVGEQLPYDDAVLAGRLELGPVRADGGVQVDLAALVEQEDDGRRDALGGGADDLCGVQGPRFGAVHVTCAGPEVDDLLPVPVDGDGRAPVTTLFEVA